MKFWIIDKKLSDNVGNGRSTIHYSAQCQYVRDKPTVSLSRDDAYARVNGTHAWSFCEVCGWSP